MTRYDSIQEIIDNVIPGIDTSWIENGRVDAHALARAISAPVQGGFEIDAEFAPDECGQWPEAMWDAVESCVEPVADLRAETLTKATPEGDWEVEVEWRPLIDTDVDHGWRTMWGDSAPVSIQVSAIAGRETWLVEDVTEVSGGFGSWVVSPRRIEDTGVELDGGEYRILSIRRDGQPAELPVDSASDFDCA